MTVTTCEHFGRACPGHHCSCRCDACLYDAARDIAKQQNKELKAATKEGKKKRK